MNWIKLVRKVFVLIGFTLLLVSCSGGEVETADTPVSAPTSEPEQPTDVAQPEPTATAVPPTDTPTEEPTEEPTEAPPPPPFELISDVPYIDDGEVKHLLDIYLPLEGEGPYTTLFVTHPGGFADGMKEWMFPFANHFASKGYAVVPINYRLAPDSTYPAQMEDAFCALAWLHKNAVEYNLDANRIVAFGYSAGATLSNLIGTIDDPSIYLSNCPYEMPSSHWVRGTVSLAGVADFAANPDRMDLLALMGQPYAEIPERWQEASPTTYVDGSEASFLLAHGLVDEEVPFAESETFAAALEAAGATVTVEPIPDAGHFFPVDFESEQTLHFLAMAEAFLDGLP